MRRASPPFPRALLLLLRLLLPLFAAPTASAAGPTQAYDCGTRRLALEFAQQLQPFRSAAELQQLADALNGSPQYGVYNCGLAAADLPAQPARLAQSAPASALRDLLLASLGDAPAFYLDSASGSDAASGSLAAPFRTIERGVAACRAAASSATLASGCTVFFRAGVYELAGPVLLTAADSGLALRAFPGDERPWISGGTTLGKLAWQPAAGARAANTWRASLAGASLPVTRPGEAIPGLRFGGRRFIRARWPNADPETQRFGSTVTPAWIAPPPLGEPPPTWISQEAFRNDTTNAAAQNFSLGYDPSPGSGCSFYSPPAGYQCGAHTTFGGSGFPQWPQGLTQQLPNAPYQPAAAGSPIVVHGFRANHWFTRQHKVSQSTFNASSNATTLLFDYGAGGFQGAWGTTSDAEFYVENAIEELDSPAEWFHDATTNELFVVWNSTGAPPATGWVATQHQVLFNVTGSQSAPVRNVSFVGLGVRDAALSFFEPHSLPSGGDWSIQRTAALFFQGAEAPLVAGCAFERMDGIVLFLSGYVRGANISYNSFAWTGETVVALWGFGDGGPVPGMGPDLTGGAQPRGTTLSFNVARELGIFQKQASFLFSAVAGLTTTVGNWAWNGPRAAINHNDGSLGGSLIDSNVMFNFCRETGDHGVFNSWDRLPYLQDVQPGGAPSTKKLFDVISRNLFIANYECMAAVDSDDVSGYYQQKNNFFSYSPFGVKADFGGHDNQAFGNVYGYLAETSWFDGPASIWCTWGAQLPGHELVFVNNTVAQDWCHDGPWPGAAYTCESNFTLGATCGGADVPGATIMGNNTYFLPIDAAHPASAVVECGVPMAQYQASCATCDAGSVALPFPADDVLFALARAALGMPAAAAAT
jgi:hypothetical protein